MSDVIRRPLLFLGECGIFGTR